METNTVQTRCGPPNQLGTDTIRRILATLRFTLQLFQFYAYEPRATAGARVRSNSVKVDATIKNV